MGGPTWGQFHLSYLLLSIFSHMSEKKLVAIPIGLTNHPYVRKSTCDTLLAMLAWERRGELGIFSKHVGHYTELRFSTVPYHGVWWSSPAYHIGFLVFPHRVLQWCIASHFRHCPTNQHYQNRHPEVVVGETCPSTQTPHSSLQSGMHEEQLANRYYAKWSPYPFQVPSTSHCVLSAWDFCNFVPVQCTWVSVHVDHLWAQWSRAEPCTMPNKFNEHKETRFSMISFHTCSRSVWCPTAPPVAERLWLELQLCEESGWMMGAWSLLELRSEPRP